MADASICVSVIVPLYNKAAYIQRCLESVLHQADACFEIIVVDDGSTDNGAVVVAGIHDPRIRLIRQQNRGAAAARNRGAALAQHDLLAFLDADDEWEPEYLASMVDLVRRFPAAQLYGAGFITCNGGAGTVQRFCGRRGPVQSLLDVFQEWVHAPAFNASSVVVRRDGFQSVGGFPEELRYNEDWILFFKMALRYPVACCRRPLVRYHKDIPAQATNALERDLPGVLPYVRWLDETYERNRANASFARFCRHAYRWTLFACIRRFGRSMLAGSVNGLHVARVLPVEGFLLRRGWHLGVFVSVLIFYYLPHVLTHGQIFGVRRT